MAAEEEDLASTKKHKRSAHDDESVSSFISSQETKTKCPSANELKAQAMEDMVMGATTITQQSWGFPRMKQWRRQQLHAGNTEQGKVIIAARQRGFRRRFLRAKDEGDALDGSYKGANSAGDDG